jgi:hypothetical protein
MGREATLRARLRAWPSAEDTLESAERRLRGRSSGLAAKNAGNAAALTGGQREVLPHVREAWLPPRTERRSHG